MLVDLRPSAIAGDAWALAELDVFAVEVEEVEGPAMGPGETVRVLAACGSFAGTLSMSDVVCGCGGEVAVVDVDVWGGDWCAGGTFSLIFPFEGRCESLEAYCGTAYGAGRSDINFVKYS